MDVLLSNCSASISELKRKPTVLLREACGEPIAIIDHNRPVAYLLSAERYEKILDMLDDFELGALVRERISELDQAIPVNLDDL